MRQFLFKGKLSEVEITSIKPFVTTNVALAGLDMKEITLADGQTMVLPQAELEEKLTVVQDPEPPVVVEVEATEPEVTVEVVSHSKKFNKKHKVLDQDNASEVS